jgi:CBS domain-containing protein
MPTVAQIMTRDVQVVRPDDTVQKAAQCMKELDIGAVPVCDGRKLLGMITDRDIAVRTSAAGLSPTTTRVSDAMTTKDLRWCTEDQDVDEVLHGMGENQVRRMPVINAKKELVGIVSVSDLATRQDHHVDELLRELSEPAHGPH